MIEIEWAIYIGPISAAFLITDAYNSSPGDDFRPLADAHDLHDNVLSS